MKLLILSFSLAHAAFSAPPYPVHSCSDPDAAQVLNQIERNAYLSAAHRDNLGENVVLLEQNAKEFQEESAKGIERQLAKIPGEVIQQLDAFFKKELSMRKDEEMSAAVLQQFPVVSVSAIAGPADAAAAAASLLQ